MSAEHHEINEETMNEEIRKFIDNMTEEQKELARKCKTPEDFLKQAEGGMIELSDEQLDMVVGGSVSRAPQSHGLGLALQSLWEEIV